MPSHNGHQVPRAGEARTTHDEPRHGTMCQGQRSGGERGRSNDEGRAKKKKKKHQSTNHANASRDSKESKKHDAPDWSIRGGEEHGLSPRTGSAGAEPRATDRSVRGNGENTAKKRPGFEHPGRGWSTAQAPGLDRPEENLVPQTGASEATKRIRSKDAPEWSNRGGTKHGTTPQTGSSGGEPGATDWSIRGNGENRKK